MTSMPDQQPAAAYGGDARVVGEARRGAGSPRPVARSSRPSSSIVSSTARAAAQATGLPPNVVPWWPGWSRSPAPPSPMQAPIGMPPPSPLARVTTSGATSGSAAAREPGPGPADAGLHLVEPQQGAVLARDPAGVGEVADGWLDDAGLALDRLEHHRRRLVGDGRGQRRGVAVRHEGDVARAAARTARGRPPWRSARARPWCARGTSPRPRPGGCGRYAG